MLYDKLNVGGTEKLFVMIANLLNSQGHNTTIVLTQSEGKLDYLIEKGISKVYLRRKSRLSFKALKQLAITCKDADTIHIHTYFNYSYYCLCRILFRINGPKVILQEHSNMHAIRWFDKLLLKSVDAFIAVSQKQIDLVKKWKVVADNKMFQISNIITVPFKIANKAIPSYKVVMVGNIRREKNYELAISIVESLKSLSLDIYGNINDFEYFKELQILIKGKEIGERIRFIQNESNVFNHFNMYDLAIHTAKFETGPLVLMEYLSAGLPFFTSNAGQSQVVISQYLPFIVVQSFDATEWVKVINGFYEQSQNDRNRLSNEFSSNASKIIDTEAYYQKLFGVYQFVQKN